MGTTGATSCCAPSDSSEAPNPSNSSPAHTTVRPLSQAALLRLTSHGWRGNVRELENTLHRAVLLAEGAAIDLPAIELSPSGIAGDPPQRTQGQGTQGQGIAALVGRRMEEVERDLIIETLGHTLGNRTHAATILGISIRALRNKLRDYAAQGVAVPAPGAGVAA